MACCASAMACSSPPAPDLLLLLRDTDGDGVADERRVVFTGFGEGNQQLRANGLVLGARTIGSMAPMGAATA